MNLFYLSFFFSILFFCCSFLDWDPLKSCVFMCLGIISMSCYMSLGLHVWYSYFVILIFLSGLFSLLTYFCSMSNCGHFNNYLFILFFLLFFLLLFLLFFDYDFFTNFLDFNFLIIYYDFSYYYVIWIIFILFLLLNLVSYGFGGNGCFMRGL